MERNAYGNYGIVYYGCHLHSVIYVGYQKCTFAILRINNSVPIVKKIVKYLPEIIRITQRSDVCLVAINYNIIWYNSSFYFDRIRIIINAIRTKIWFGHAARHSRAGVLPHKWGNVPVFSLWGKVDSFFSHKIFIIKEIFNKGRLLWAIFKKSMSTNLIHCLFRYGPEISG